LKEGKFVSSDLYIPFTNDFTERVFKKEYYNVSYVIKKIGGIHAVIAPIINYFMILFTFNFLFHLSKVFLKKNEETYKTDFVKYLQLSKQLIFKMQTQKTQKKCLPVLEEIDRAIRNLNHAKGLERMNKGFGDNPTEKRNSEIETAEALIK